MTTPSELRGAAEAATRIRPYATNVLGGCFGALDIAYPDLAYADANLALQADLFAILDAYATQRKALEEIARGDTPPEQHGHYTAHRRAVEIARHALRTKEGKSHGE